MKEKFNFKTTADIQIPKIIVDQIIGQEGAVNIIKKAARQRRHVLLIGEPGTGKSLTGQALAELLPKESLVDVISLHNQKDENSPVIKVVQKGKGSELVDLARLQASSAYKSQNLLFLALVILSVFTPWWIRKQYGDIMAAASLIGSMIFLASFILFINLNKKMKAVRVPKLLIDNSNNKKANFVDATGAHAGALLGDVLHDPLQSFFPNQKVIKLIENKEGSTKLLHQLKLNELLDPMFKKNKHNLIKQKKYEAFFANKNELFVLGNKNNTVEDVEVLSANRYPYKNNLIKFTTESGKELIVTPEHKVAVKRFGKTFYKEASKLTRFDKVITLNLD